MSTQSRIEVKLHKLREYIIRVANKDGKISEEEVGLLTNIKGNLPDLAAKVKAAYADNELSVEERKEINLIMGKLMDDAVTAATFDDFVSQEEKEILQTLKSLLIDIGRNLK